MEPTLQELETLKQMCAYPEFRSKVLREATLGNVPLAIMAAFAAGVYGAYRPEGEEQDTQTGVMYALAAAGLVLGGSYLYNARGIERHCEEQRFNFNP